MVESKYCIDIWTRLNYCNRESIYIRECLIVIATRHSPYSCLHLIIWKDYLEDSLFLQGILQIKPP